MQCTQVILKASPLPNQWKNYLPQNQSLAPKRLGTAVLEAVSVQVNCGGLTSYGFNGQWSFSPNDITLFRIKIQRPKRVDASESS